MKNKWQITTVIAFSLLMLTLPKHVSAHVLLRDSANHASAIFHITPDDEPKRSESAGLYFQVQSGDALTGAIAMLIVQEDTMPSQQLALRISGSTAMVNYTFAEAGIYHLHLQITKRGEPQISFMYDQLVSDKEGSHSATPAWATVGLAGSAVGQAIIVIYGWNNRRAIAKYSKF